MNRTAGASPAGLNAAEADLDLADIIRVIYRRRALLLKCLLATLVLAVLFLLVAKRRYRADAVMQITTQRTSSNISTLTGADEDSSALQLSTTLQTYVSVLTSENLALQVIRELKLDESKEYKVAAEHGEGGLPLERTRYRREKVLRRFEKNLKVAPGSGSRILNVSFMSVDPNTAKQVLDRLLQDFIGYNAGIRYNASERSESWLKNQLIDLKAQVQKTQEAAILAQRDTGIYGNDGTHDLVLSRLDTLQTELTSAEQNRIVKGAILHVVEKGGPEAISNLSSTAGQAVAPGSVNSLALVQTLRQQEAALSSQYAQLSAEFGPGYPRMAEVEKQLADIRSSIAAETTRLTERAANDFKAAADQESSLARQVDEQKTLANKSNDVAVRYLIAAHEATSTRDLYEHLLEKAEELGVVAGLDSSDIEIIDPAHVGTSATPEIPIILAEATGLGLLLGLCAALLRDSLDRSLYKPQLIQSMTGLPLLGVVPAFRASEFAQGKLTGRTGSVPQGESQPPAAWGAAITHPSSRFVEAVRAVRTAIFVAPRFGPTKLLMVASAARGEGKGVFTFNLATLLAQEGRRVLVVDADLRQGALTRNLGLSGVTGLSDLLAGSVDGEQYDKSVRRVGLIDFMPTGSPASLPAELLASPKMELALQAWRATYDQVLLCTAPLVSVTDTVALSRRVDGVLLLGRAYVTQKSTFTRACELLRSVDAPLIGAVYNAIDTHAPEYPLYAGKDGESQEASSPVKGVSPVLTSPRRREA